MFSVSRAPPRNQRVREEEDRSPTAPDSSVEDRSWARSEDLVFGRSVEDSKIEISEGGVGLKISASAPGRMAANSSGTVPTIVVCLCDFR